MKLLKNIIQIPTHLILIIFQLLSYLVTGINFIFTTLKNILNKYKTLSSIIILILSGLGYLAYSYDIFTTKVTAEHYTINLTTPNNIRGELQLTFSNSENDDVAPIDKKQKVITEGISITPKIEGSWFWYSGATLQFTPTTNFNLNTEYTIKIDPEKLLAKNVKLSPTQATSLQFKTENLSYEIKKTEFYQDPQNPKNYQTIFNLVFSQKLSHENIKDKISLKLYSLDKDKKEYIFTKNIPFELSYKEDKYSSTETVWIKSQAEAIQLMEQDSYVILDIAPGIKSNIDGGIIDTPIQKKLSIPNRNQLTINDAEIIIIPNENNELQPIVNLSFSSPVKTSDVAKHIQANLFSHADDTKNVDDTQPLPEKSIELTPIPTEKTYSNLISFSFNAKPKDILKISIPSKSINSQNHFTLGTAYARQLEVPAYPEILSFIADGSILSLTDDKKIAYRTQGIKNYKTRIARVLPDQLQHLVALTHDDFTRMNFGHLSSNHFTESFVNLHTNIDGDIHKNQINTVDLTPFLKENNSNNKGIFLIELYSTDSVDDTNQDKIGYYDHLQDKRFIMITDMGMISKKSLNNERDVYLQSIKLGKPIANAKISAIGINGQNIISKTTDTNGHVNFTNEELYKNNIKPIMFVAEANNDFTFLPMFMYDRQLNFSKFDINGVREELDTKGIKTHIFSDRMVYRPGETLNIGTIIKALNFTTSLAGIPIDVVIENAQSQEIYTKTITLDNYGFNEVSYKIPATAMTGTWYVYVYLHGDNDDKNKRIYLTYTPIMVRDFEADKTKVDFQLANKDHIGWVKPTDLVAKLKATTLFDTPAQNRDIKTSILLEPHTPTFDKYPEYNFYQDIDKKAQNIIEQDLNTLKTDENGYAEINIGEQINSFVGNYTARIMTEVFEAESGKSVSALLNTYVSANNMLIGVKTADDLNYVHKNTPANLNFIAIDASLNSIDVENLQLTFAENKYVSVLVKQDSGVYAYESVKKQIPISTENINISKNTTNYQLKTDIPGNYVVALQDTDNNILYRQEYTVVGDGNVSRNLDQHTELKLKLDKTTYNTGDNIELYINTPYIGNGLITIERDKIYTAKWFKTTENNSIQTIQIPEGLDGNAYVNVQFMRDINSPEIFMSPLSYGIAPFNISTDKLKSKLTIAADKQIKPGQNIQATVTTEHPEKVLVFAVDEGILNYANYKLADPLDTFFKKIALSVETDQILDLILPKYKLLLSLAKAGGGGDEEDDALLLLKSNLNPFKRKQDKPAIFWSGIQTINDSATFDIPVPETFNGNLVIMAIAVGENSVGINQTNTIVKDDFVLTPNAPYFVSPNDEFEVSVNVTNSLDNLNDEKIPVQLTITPAEQFSLIGNVTQTLTLAKKEDGIVKFKMKANDILGNGELKFSLAYQDKIITRNINIAVRPVNTYQTNMQTGRLQKNDISLKNPLDPYPNYYKYNATISYNPMVLAKGLSVYLENYMYDCSEQLLSKLVPLLVASTNPELNLATDNTQTSIADLFKTLKSRQNHDGFIGYWRRNSSDHEPKFITLYAVDFMLLAQEKGYNIDTQVLNRANQFLEKIVSHDIDESITLNDLREHIYALYLLTKQQKMVSNIPELIDTVSKIMQKNKTWQTDVTTAYLAASLKHLQLDKDARKLIEPLINELNKKYNQAWWSNNYYDPLIINADIIYLLNKEFPEYRDKIPYQALENIVTMLNENRYNSLSSAKLILALDAYAKNLTANIDGQTNLLTIKDSNGKTLSTINGLMAKIEDTNILPSINFNNPVNTPAWFAYTQQGYNKRQSQESVANGLEIHRDYTDLKGNPISEVTQGDEIFVNVKVKSSSTEGIDNIAIIDLLPGGFDVVQSKINNNDNDEQVKYWSSPIATKYSWYPNNTDVREDRVIIYGDLDNNQIQDFQYKIKATSVGEYTVIPIYAESMYDRSINATSASGSKDGVNKIKVIPR